MVAPRTLRNAIQPQAPSSRLFSTIVSRREDKSCDAAIAILLDDTCRVREWSGIKTGR